MRVKWVGVIPFSFASFEFSFVGGGLLYNSILFLIIFSCTILLFLGVEAV